MTVPLALPTTASGGSGSPTRRRGRAWVWFAVFALAFQIWNVISGDLASSVASAAGSIAYIALNIGATWWLLRAAANPLHAAGERTGLRMLAAMYTCTALGNLTWAFELEVLKADPVDSWANLFFVPSYLFGIVAIMSFPVAPRGQAELRKSLIDAASVMIAVGALIWTFLVERTDWMSMKPTPLLLGLFYPAACVLILALISRQVMRQPANEPYGKFLVLLAAVAAQYLVDLLLELGYRGSIALSTFSAIVLPLLYVLLIRGAEQLARPTFAQRATRNPDPALNPANLLPMLSAMTLYAVLIWTALSLTHEALPLLVFAAIGQNILFLIKQTIAVRENARMVTARAEAESRAKYAERAREGQKLEAIGRLAGGIAHDFNNLLTTVLANSEFALSKLHPSDPVHAEVSDVHSAAVRGAELIQQILAFSRKSLIEPVRVQPDLVLREMRRLLERLAGMGYQLHFDMAHDIGLVEVGRGQLEQVIANLVTNARDAMPDGGRIVLAGRNMHLDDAAASALELTPGAYVTISVADDGTGIEPAVRAQIFEPFFSTKPRGQGTGLGLASSYGIMRQSHGAIDVTSKPGAGAVFTIFLPRVFADTPTPTEPPTVITPLQVRGRGETILLVEDDPSVRQITRRILASEGYTVFTAQDADTAHDLCARHGTSVALLITDVRVAGARGQDLAALLRTTRADLPVIFVSGSAMSAPVPERQEPHAHDLYLAKPFSGAQLLDQVAALLAPAWSPIASSDRSP